MSAKFAPKIIIKRTGDKFPPHGYDPSALPGSVVKRTRSNGQIHAERRARSRPIVVRSPPYCHWCILLYQRVSALSRSPALSL
jgi:hypothetical protein